MTEVLRERGASGYFKKLVVLVREHVTSAMIGGLVLMLTGFSPEDWFVEAMHAIHLPKAWSLGIDPRILLVTLGVAIIVGDQLLRRRTASQAELAGAGPGIAASPQAVAATQQSASTPALALPETPSIAVLQFSNISGDAAQEYFSDGMVEDIISGLSRVKWLFVIARNSSFTYKGKAVDVKQVGRELGVRYVLEGGLRKSADRLRITAQLIDAATGAHVWAERYDRKADDVFALQVHASAPMCSQIRLQIRHDYVRRLCSMPDTYARRKQFWPTLFQPRCGNRPDT